MEARSVRFTAPRRVEVVEADVRPPGPGEVLVRTLWSGISGGTELLAYRGELDPSMPVDEALGALGGTFAYPFSFGYSCVGTVEEGELPEGTLVFAFHPHQDLFTVAVDDTVLVDGSDPRTATLFPLVETALQASLDCGDVRHERVAVLGLGPVGILTAALLGESGAEVVGADPRPWRREAAGAFGVRAVEPDRVGDGLPVVVEASGRGEVLASALDLLAHEGTALVLSWYGTTPVPLPLGGAFHRRRLVIRSSQVSTIPSSLSGRWDVPRRRSVARGLLDRLPLKALATDSFPLEDAAEAYEAIDSGRPGLVHAALRHR